ncbi:hypothetical protein GMMP1_1100013 [Candidatus Magnetomoraceae bacterium gMMP-1]
MTNILFYVNKIFIKCYKRANEQQEALKSEYSNKAQDYQR